VRFAVDRVLAVVEVADGFGEVVMKSPIQPED